MVEKPKRKSKPRQQDGGAPKDSKLSEGDQTTVEEGRYRFASLAQNEEKRRVLILKRFQ